jgi:hypothetical protein
MTMARLPSKWIFRRRQHSVQITVTKAHTQRKKKKYLVSCR